MIQQKEPKPLTPKEILKFTALVVVLIIAGIIIYGLLDLLFPVG